MTYYDILGVSRYATDEEIKKAYRSMLKAFHPDSYNGDKEFAARKTREVIEAYNILKNHATKKVYDEHHIHNDTYEQKSYTSPPPEPEPEPQPEPKPKGKGIKTRTHCKYCGSRLPEDSAMCCHCGNKNPEPLKVKKWILPILLILAVSGYVYELKEKLFIEDMLGESCEIILAKIEEVEALQLEIDELKAENKDMKFEVASLTADKTYLTDFNKSLSKQNAESFGKARFLDEHIGIVLETGTKYHKYDCQYVRGKTFWAYNIEAAVSRGYTPCSVCYGNGLFIPSLADVQSGRWAIDPKTKERVYDASK